MPTTTDKMIQLSFVTRNEHGKFEVEYELDSFWKRLLGMKTRFKFYTDSTELKYNKYPSSNAGLYYNWFDEDNVLVEDIKILNNISLCVRGF